MKSITVNDDLYIVCGTVSVDKVTNISTNELKKRYSLANAVLRNGDVFYICMKVIEAEFEDIK
tara:strand:+ start:439 stop:627 length:189 start_codon:yes stop_codon:yes gene_type:complete